MDFHSGLKCGVERVEYDFHSAKGTLHVPDGDCCDMKGCIEFFQALDPKVQAIDTFSGAKPDTGYRLERGEWKASFPR